MTTCRLDSAATDELLAAIQAETAGASGPRHGAQLRAARLGAHCTANRVEAGFWTPDLAALPQGAVFLEVFTAQEAIDFTAGTQRVPFWRERLALRKDGEYWWGVVEGMIPGTRAQAGSFYWLAYQDSSGTWQHRIDPLAFSMPFGVFAPSECYDMDTLDRDRADRDYFATLETPLRRGGLPVIAPPANILQAHVQTSTREGTIAALAAQYRALAARITSGEALAPAESVWLGYDALQLLPVDPVSEPSRAEYWAIVEDNGDTVMAALNKPYTLNWGYDPVIAGASAVNPALLASGRPDEFVELAAALHHFPNRPIKLILDVVLSHGSFQAGDVLPGRYFFNAENWYGHSLNIADAQVRAVLLEMLRRKAELGVDGFRVDASHDFKHRDPESGEIVTDDRFLAAMCDIAPQVAGWAYHPCMIFEDARRLPDLYSGDYSAVTRTQPEALQWGPVTTGFNNAPLAPFWRDRWLDLEATAREGRSWISGLASHDTYRHAAHIDPRWPPNPRLGKRKYEAVRAAYDDPAAALLWYAALPGVPQDFLHAAARAPWTFLRDADDALGVLTIANEYEFLDWFLPPEQYAKPGCCERLKALGFADWAALRRFMKTLQCAIGIAEYQPTVVVEALNAVKPPLANAPGINVPLLERIAMAWMADLRDYCVLPPYLAQLNPAHAAFTLKVREFRRARPWLRENFDEAECFGRLPMREATVAYAMRIDPAGEEHILFAANLSGETVEIVPGELPIAGLPFSGWELGLVTPGLAVSGPGDPLALESGRGVVFLHG